MSPHLAVRKVTSYLICTQEEEQKVGPDCKSSKPAPNDLFPKEGSTLCMFYNLPNSTPSWEPSVQTCESTGAFHIQTTMGRKLLKKADEHPCSGIC